MGSRKIEDLVPELQPIIKELQEALEREVPDAFRIACTYRPQIEQDALYLRGRADIKRVNAAYRRAGLAPITIEENKRKVTWRRVSEHTSRRCVDFFIQRDDRYVFDTKVDTDGDKIEDWQEFGRIAEGLGLEWGGRWKHPDLPHVQLKEA